MAWTSLRLLRQFSRSRSSLHVALSSFIIPPDILPHVLKTQPAAPPPPSSWQQFSRLPCLPCRPLVNLQNLGSTGQHDRNVKEVSQPGLESEAATSEWSLQCRRNHIHIHIPALYSTSALYGTSCQNQRGEAREAPEASDRGRDITHVGNDVANVSITRASVEFDVADDCHAPILGSDVAKVSFDVAMVESAVAIVESAVAIVESDVAEVTEILLSLGCCEPQLERLLKKYSVTLIKYKQHIPRKAAMFRQYGINSLQFFKALLRDSCKRQRILSCTDDRQVSVLDYLQNTLKVQNLGKLVSTWPMVLNYPPSTLDSKLQLWSSLDVPITASILEKYPNIFSSSDKSVKEGIAGVKAIFPDPFGRIILSKFPPLAWKKRQDLQQGENGLQELFGDDVAKQLLVMNPRILMAPLSTIRHTYAQLKQVFGEERCLKMVQIQPALIGLSWSSLGPKLEFLVKEMGRSMEEVATNSGLTYSLEKRLKPRYDALIKANVESGNYSLSAIFNPTNKAFEDQFGVSLPRGGP